MIGIIGAMEEEVAAIKAYMAIQQERKILDCVFYEGTIARQEVVLLQGGIGKVNAAVCATLLLTTYNITYVLNIGSAGGLHLAQSVGDLVISNTVTHHDVDVTAFGRALGEVPGYPVAFPADEKLVTTVQAVVTDLEIPFHIGNIVSGDQFIANEEQVTTIKTNFKEALCAEMEAAAIAQTCYKFKIPFIVLRSLSDVFNKGDSSMQFDAYLKIASENSARICFEIISRHQA